jgi:hypothetical protein
METNISTVFLVLNFKKLKMIGKHSYITRGRKRMPAYENV